MRPFLRRYFLAIFALGLAGVLAACSHSHPPLGRWQGFYEDSGLMIAARLEIAANGDIRVSAPNAMADFASIPADDRRSIRENLVAGLVQAWPHVGAIALDFDGKDFHKPGGVAPQLEWDSGAQQMTLVFYSGNRPSVRVKLDQVADFD